LHPALTPLLEVFEFNDNAVAISAYLPGDNLWSWVIEKAKILPMKPSVETALFLLDGLIHLKQAGWDYHNIHPWNIVLPPANPQRPRLCTADLDRPYLLDCHGNSDRDPSREERIKVLFLPRERILNYKQLSPTQDVYAMGATLYFLLTRECVLDVPFRPTERWNEDPVKVILTDEPIPIQQRDRNIPDELALVVDRAVSRKAAARFPSLEAFRQALQSALKLIPS
jgi:serine/threonine protein kinase